MSKQLLWTVHSKSVCSQVIELSEHSSFWGFLQCWHTNWILFWGTLWSRGLKQPPICFCTECDITMWTPTLGALGHPYCSFIGSFPAQSHRSLLERQHLLWPLLPMNKAIRGMVYTSDCTSGSAVCSQSWKASSLYWKLVCWLLSSRWHRSFTHYLLWLRPLRWEHVCYEQSALLWKSELLNSLPVIFRHPAASTVIILE